MKKVKELKKWIELYNEVHAAAEEVQLALENFALLQSRIIFQYLFHTTRLINRLHQLNNLSSL